ncbi:30S ribosomal protein S21, chloroplastic [Dendrobium catenatum]|uniref:30S ribosomal protein S21, chloroplastic n=1 Tax=Dendrobium catenatum TaxID=906689 RepID=A0A2I0VIP6_9ASPA|nr:30S ribosomal protein S21, chloroplastic [Dendrobium catenatum]XP_020687377.1 30S ribosomal protein S21, chloroplastic [Dendrobium catenatum]XP_020687378.1 30S ribosomal protein S21, chloroplastic [Dendrobium catenatum]PKU63288.1 30S ribosomal protein S21, chloroplastic [Dendrobium catenatum]
MAAALNLPQPTFPKIPSLPSPLSPSRFFIPASCHRKFPTLSTAAAAVSLAVPLGPLATIGSVDSVEAMVNPALVYANFLYFKSGYNVQIFVEENEPEEVLLRRFRREVSKAGIIQECKRRRFFENKHDELKRKKREACRRNRRRRFSGPRLSSSSSREENSATKKASDDLDDNWEYHDIDLP